MAQEINPLKIKVKSSPRLAAGDLSGRTGLPLAGGHIGRLTGAFDERAERLEAPEVVREESEQALKASEMRYRRLFETAQDGIFILNAKTGEIEDVNPFLTNLLGYSREALLGKRLWETGPFKDIEASKAQFTKLQRKGYVRFENLPLETSDGRSIQLEFVCNVYRVGDRNVIQCNIRDITERRAAEKQRKEYSRKLQVLSRRLVDVQETERRHLARELHDEIGQALTVARLNLQAMLRMRRSAAMARRLAESLRVVEHVLEQVRDIALNLRPSMLDDLGLEPALQWYTKRQAVLAGLKSEVRADPLVRRLDPMIETACFRVAQEAIMNVVRHAKAHNVAVELRQEQRQLHLRVRDDGGGFDVAPVRAQAVLGASLGLLSMEERVALAGGQIEFKSAPGHGAEVHAWFPLRRRRTRA